MHSHALIHLLDGGPRGWQFPQCVQQHEVVDGPVIANGVDTHAGCLELSRVGLALITQRVILCGNDKRGRQAAELIKACA